MLWKTGHEALLDWSIWTAVYLNRYSNGFCLTTHNRNSQLVVKPHEIRGTCCLYDCFFLVLIYWPTYWTTPLQILLIMTFVVRNNFNSWFGLLSSLVTLIADNDALLHSFVSTLQKLSDFANLIDCWICARANHTHDAPELVDWPLSSGEWKALTNKNVGFCFGIFENKHSSPSLWETCPRYYYFPLGFHCS